MEFTSFIFKNQKYEISNKLLKDKTGYFKVKGRREEDLVFLVDEFEIYPELSEENIKTFIKYLQTDDIEINNNNYLPIHFLSEKFEVQSLISKTNEYTNQNYKTILDEFLDKKQESKTYYNQLQEEVLSSHMIEYIDDDRLTLVPIPVLFRIFNQTFKQEIYIKEEEKDKFFTYEDDSNNDDKDKNDEDDNDDADDNDDENVDDDESDEGQTKDKKERKQKSKVKRKKTAMRGIGRKKKIVRHKKTKNSPNKRNTRQKDRKDEKEKKEENHQEYEAKIIEFIINCIKEQGSGASILLKTLELSKTGNEYLIKKLSEEKHAFDIDINSISTQIIEYLSNKSDEYEIKNQEMRNHYEQQIKANKEEMEKEFHKIISQVEQEIQEMKREYLEEIEKLKEEENTKRERFTKEMNKQNEENINSIKTIESEMNNNKASIDHQIKEIESEMNSNKTNIDHQIKEIESEMNSNKTNIDHQIKEIQTDISNNKTNINHQIEEIESEMNSNKTNIDHQIKEIQTDISNNQASINRQIEEIESEMNSNKTNIDH